MVKSACLALFVILIAGCGSGQAQFYYGQSYRFRGYAPHYQVQRGFGSQYGYRGYAPHYQVQRGFGSQYGYRGYAPHYQVQRGYGPGMVLEAIPLTTTSITRTVPDMVLEAVLPITGSLGSVVRPIGKCPPVPGLPIALGRGWEECK